jgi:hypothetical protein
MLCLLGRNRGDDLDIPIASDIVKEPFRGPFAGKLSWNNRVCDGTRIVGNIGIPRISLAPERGKSGHGMA